MSDPRDRALILLQRHGWNATSFQILEAGFHYWFDRDDACVAYADTGSAWVTAGAPIAAPERLAETAAAFAAHARAVGRRVCFFGTEDRFHERVPSFGCVHIGEQAVWNPQHWPRALAGSRGLREQVRRARAKGVEVRALALAEIDLGTPMRAAIERLIARWLSAKAMAPMGFLVAVQVFAYPHERRYFAAEQDGVLVGFLAAVPVYARGGWLFEDLVRAPDAPNGTAERLIDAAMGAVAAERSTYATLGLAPLAGVRGWLRLARGASAALYDFAGVRAFKAKLRPDFWEPINVALPPGASVNAALYDVLAAFAHGSFARFGLRSLLRGPALVVRALAVALVPWILALALAPSATWFPWPWVKWSWVAFDAVLAAGMLSLAARWRRRLGEALAVAVSIDATATLAEACVYNLPLVRHATDAAVIGVACAAPATAAIILWGALARRAP